jgi:hypothetical protein
MDESAGGQASVVVVLGPGAHAEVVAHTKAVLNHFGIAFQEVGWSEFPNLLAGGESGWQVVIFATGIAYTVEHIALPPDLPAPVFRVVTDPAPPPDQMLTDTGSIGTMGFGVPGAVNAGLMAARILATNDPALRDLLTTNPYPVP